VARLPPGPRAPAAINVAKYILDPLGYFTRMRERYGDVFTVSFPSFRNVVYVAEPGLVKKLFTGEPTELHAGEANATVLEPAVGPSSVLTLDEGEHMRQRKILLAPFHGRAIDHYRDTMLASTRRDLDTWPVGQPFALRDHTQRITLDVILRAVYGFSEADNLEEAHHVVDEFARLSDALILPAFLRRPLGRRSPWTRFLRARAELDRLVYQAIADRRAAGDADERDDVLSLLMRARDEDGNEPTDRELRDELVTVVGAGHETTATALAWAMERLLRNRRVLDRLRTALADGDEEGYLDAVIKETLRVRPIIVDVARRATVPFEIGGYTVPAGTLVLASIAALHYRPDLYEDPSAFRPERWLNGAPDSYAWIPFGGGVRRCLGAAFAHEEMKIVLREVVLRADLRAVSAEDEKPVLRNITLAPKHGAQVMLAAPLRPVAEADAVAASVPA
jgi:cytochrome P450